MSNRLNSAQDYRYIYTQLDTNPSLFRYWGELPREVLEVLRYRSPLGHYLTEGITKRALQPGYDLVDNDDQIVHEDEDMNNEYQEEIIIKYTKARAAEKAYGYAVLVHLEFEQEDTTAEEQLYWIEDTYITDMQIKAATKEITKLMFTPPNYLGYSSQEPIVVEKQQLEDVRLLGNYDSTIGYFRSWLEPVADDLIALSNLAQQSALYMIRIGSGIRYIIAPQSLMANASNRNKFKNFLEEMGINSILTVPDGSAEQGDFEFGIKFGEGTPPDYTIHRNIHLDNISMYTGLPREELIGNEKGLRSAEVNRQSANDVYVIEQNISKSHIAWMEGKKRDCQDCTEGRHLPRFKPMVTMDEDHELDQMAKKFDILQKAKPELIKAMDNDQLLEQLGIDIEIDQAKLQQIEEQNEVLRNQLAEEGIGSNNEPEDENEGEEPAMVTEEEA